MRSGAQQDQAAATLRRVLVVDDDDSVRGSLRRLLESESFEVHDTCSADGALRILRSIRIDVAVLDLNLGPDSGWDIFRHIAESEAFVPVVVVTAEWGQHGKAVELGVEALLEKPIEVQEFLEALNRLLARGASGRARREPGCREYCRFVPRLSDAATRLSQNCSETDVKANQKTQTAPCPPRS